MPSHNDKSSHKTLWHFKNGGFTTSWNNTPTQTHTIHGKIIITLTQKGHKNDNTNKAVGTKKISHEQRIQII